MRSWLNNPLVFRAMSAAASNSLAHRPTIIFPPLAVSPRKACVLLDCGNTHLYELLRDGELDSYLDGRARRITVESIRRRIAQLLATASATGTASEDRPQRHLSRKAQNECADRKPQKCNAPGRGRPHKRQLTTADRTPLNITP
jgi:excisionase family DNA binding protein